MLLRTFLVATATKLIVVASYTSTDFEVHRNWMAITFNLPLDEWYTDETSEWTLDYPPFFAWFEYLLSLAAFYIDSNMLILKNLNYKSLETILFMRLSVIVTDLVLALGCKRIADWIRQPPIRKCSRWKNKWTSPCSIFYMLVLGNTGLFIVDHIHFQYNGFLFGILLLSIACILRGEYIMATVWFSILINLKHLFLYMSPVFFIYTLKNYCAAVPDLRNNLQTILERIFHLGLIVLFITTLSFGPFFAAGQFTQVISRLFPFKRGLCHAYWAPNFWALYNVGDKALVFVIKIFYEKYPDIPLISSIAAYFYDSIRKAQSGSMTSGRIQNYEHLILPRITPAFTALLVVLSSLPCLVKLWRSPQNPLHFVRALIICTSCAFFFGWHVHEKAILMVIIPMSMMAVVRLKEAEHYTFLSTIAHFSLLPLLYRDEEFILKTSMLIFFILYVIITLSDSLDAQRCNYWLTLFPNIPLFENLFIVFGAVPIFIYEHLIQGCLYPELKHKYPFMPLLLYSTYSAIGIGYGTYKYYKSFLNMDDSLHKVKTF